MVTETMLTHLLGPPSHQALETSSGVFASYCSFEKRKGVSHGPGSEVASITPTDASVGGHITPSPACEGG